MKRVLKVKKLLSLIVVAGFLFSCANSSISIFDDRRATLAEPGDDLQKILDSGYDLHLRKSQIYKVSKALKFKKA